MKYRVLLILLFAVNLGFGQIYIDSYRFASAAGPTLPILENNLIAYYDASNSLSYPGSGSTWFDLSGNDRDLTIYGATYSANNDGVFDFDGSNDYMEYNTVINQPLKSISIWFKSDLPFNNQNPQVLTDFSDFTYNYNIRIGDLSGTETTEDISFGASVPNEEYSFLKTAPNSAGVWYNLTINYNGSTYDFYVNNTLYPKYTLTVFGLPHMSLHNIFKLGLGKRFFSNSLFFNGQIGETFIYSEALTTQQMTDNYNATKTRYGY